MNELLNTTAKACGELVAADEASATLDTHLDQHLALLAALRRHLTDENFTGEESDRISQAVRWLAALEDHVVRMMSVD